MRETILPKITRLTKGVVTRARLHYPPSSVSIFLYLATLSLTLCLPICLSVRLSVRLSVWSVCLFVSLPLSNTHTSILWHLCVIEATVDDVAELARERGSPVTSPYRHFVQWRQASHDHHDHNYRPRTFQPILRFHRLRLRFQTGYTPHHRRHFACLCQSITIAAHPRWFLFLWKFKNILNRPIETYPFVYDRRFPLLKNQRSSPFVNRNIERVNIKFKDNFARRCIVILARYECRNSDLTVYPFKPCEPL